MENTLPKSAPSDFDKKVSSTDSKSHGNDYTESIIDLIITTDKGSILR